MIGRRENDPDGKFFASGFDATKAGPNRQRAQARGNWWIGEIGKCCVTLARPKKTEQWCRVLFKLRDTYYGAKPAGDQDADAMQFEFRR